MLSGRSTSRGTPTADGRLSVSRDVGQRGGAGAVRLRSVLSVARGARLLVYVGVLRPPRHRGLTCRPETRHAPPEPGRGLWHQLARRGAVSGRRQIAPHASCGTRRASAALRVPEGPQADRNRIRRARSLNPTRRPEPWRPRFPGGGTQERSCGFHSPRERFAALLRHIGKRGRTPDGGMARSQTGRLGRTVFA